MRPRLVAVAGRDAGAAGRVRRPLRLRARHDRLARADRRRRRASSPTSGPTPCMPSRRSKRRARASTCCARSRLAATRRSRSSSSGGRGDRRHGAVRVQLPVRPRRPAGAPDPRGRRPRRPPPRPLRLPAGLGRRRRRVRLALRRERGGLGRSRRPCEPCRRPGALPRRRDRHRHRPRAAHSSRAARSTTPWPPRCGSRGGAVGTLEATRFATGNVNRLTFEINGSRGANALRPRAAQRARGRRPAAASAGCS